ncbi:MAG: hypothetical protein WEC59_00320 [Salibacteraceae bacterium]
MIVNEDSFTRNFEISQKVKPLFKLDNRDYYWYRSNKVMKTRGGSGGKLLHGTYTEYHLNKNLRAKGKMRKGLKVGKWFYWHDNGMIAVLGRYRHGLLRGKFLKFSKKGDLIEKARYRFGEKHGKSFRYVEGELIGVEKYKRGYKVEASTSSDDEESHDDLEKAESNPQKTGRKERKRLNKILKRQIETDDESDE